MSNVIEPDYERQWLFPPSLEDLLPAGHQARLVREFVDASLRLLANGGRAAESPLSQVGPGSLP